MYLFVPIPMGVSSDRAGVSLPTFGGEKKFLNEENHNLSSWCSGYRQIMYL